MNLKNLIEDGSSNISVTVTLSVLKDFADYIISQTKKELEDALWQQNQEKYISAKQACELLDINNSTLWRWVTKKYLSPIAVGGKRRYKMSDINRMFQKSEA
jgi:excisionase family DNA binding protein